MRTIARVLAGLLIAGSAMAQDEDPEVPPEAPPEPPPAPVTEAPPPPAEPVPVTEAPPAPAEPPPAEPMGSDDEKHNCGAGEVCCVSSDGWPSEDGKYKCVPEDQCKDPNQQKVKDIGIFCKK